MRYISAKMKATEGRGSIVQNDYTLFSGCHWIADGCSSYESQKNGWSLT